FIKVCRQNGVAISIGHSNASADQIDDAVRAGAGLSTHLGNGCANFIHRHHNPIWPQLANDNLVSSVIADGLHLLPDELRVFYKVKGPDNLFVISDISSLSGMAPGKYTYLGSEVLLTEEGMLLNAGENCLAGASFPIIKGVGNMMKFTGCSLSQAINMASANVARFYNLSDRGTLTPGKRADIIMFENTENQIKIKKTLLGGNLVFSSPNT
ncbi:MAG TPA: amidohydrolase family protein, partial [Bacteroidales bacterium]|nr:amidohydrolase family protein [Bacteroidales bacterium]